ncbi:PEP-CTERM sorting domain-containing protein [Planctomycetes bacterium K23_9]|uniref:Ice-binding protein C-terminal domain-containing protein n=1 Tax=Stieleria marina TaxID=1930275 RepID=A0A517P105_9BACT|nr:hypothetical protein K239x_50800 [Planctomycetes bacterium K23_9]
MNKLYQAFTFLILLSVSVADANADLVLMMDDFSANTVEQSTRFNNGDIDSGNWIKRNADWSVTGGALVNPGNDADDERGAHLINSVTSTDTSLTQIKVSFDYSVGAGTTLYFSSSLFTGDPAAAGLNARVTQTNGAWFASDFNNESGSFGGFVGSDYNLNDGSNPSGGTGGALASFAGATTGTFSQTYDISGFGGGPFSIADVNHVMAVFTSNNDTTGGEISVTNFNMTATAVPEPSSFALLGGALACFAAGRRRRRAKAAG